MKKTRLEQVGPLLRKAHPLPQLVSRIILKAPTIQGPSSIGFLFFPVSLPTTSVALSCWKTCSRLPQSRIPLCYLAISFLLSLANLPHVALCTPISTASLPGDPSASGSLASVTTAPWLEFTVPKAGANAPALQPRGPLMTRLRGQPGSMRHC